MLKPSAVLLHFMKEMNEWEKRCIMRTELCVTGGMKIEEATRIGTGEYMSIFQRYCSPTQALPRDYHFTEPPDYDPVGETIISECEESSGLFQIRTQQNYCHRKKHIFIMALEHGEWRIVARKVLLDSNEILDTSL
jgi:hypothetical protein